MAIMCKFHENLRIESRFLIGLVLCDPVEKNIRRFFFISWFTDPPTQIFAI